MYQRSPSLLVDAPEAERAGRVLEGHEPLLQLPLHRFRVRLVRREHVLVGDAGAASAAASRRGTAPRTANERSGATSGWAWHENTAARPALVAHFRPFRCLHGV